MPCLCFTTIKNYTALKPNTALDMSICRFTTIKNYTTLKHPKVGLAQYTEVKVVFHRGEYLSKLIVVHGFLILQFQPR